MRSCPRSRGSGGLARFAGASGSKAVPRPGLKTGSRSPPRQRGCLLGPGKVAGFPVGRTEVAPPVPASGQRVPGPAPPSDRHGPRPLSILSPSPSASAKLTFTCGPSPPVLLPVLPPVLPAPQPPADPSRAAAAASRQAGEDDASLSTSSRRSRFEEGEAPNGARKRAAGLPEGAA